MLVEIVLMYSLPSGQCTINCSKIFNMIKCFLPLTPPPKKKKSSSCYSSSGSNSSGSSNSCSASVESLMNYLKNILILPSQMCSNLQPILIC